MYLRKSAADLNNATFPMTVSYIPVEDTTGTLEALNVDPEVYLYSGGVLASWDGEAYNPTRFRLTLEDGTVYVFDKYQGLLSITDPYGHAISYSDDAITHSSGASLSIERDTSNRIEYIKDQLSRTVEYQYDEDGMLTKVIQHGEGPYPMRVLEAMGYQQGLFERPVLKDIIAPDGTRLGTFEYDSSGRKTALIDHNGNRMLFGYDAPSHEYTVTDRRGNPTSYTYDSDGNVTSITDAEGSTETYTYDADGNVLAKTNKLGYTNSFTYDADGNVLSETDPLGNMVTFTYDSDGNRLSVTDPLGNTTEFTYDANGNPLTTEDALDHLTTFTYDADGLMQSTIDTLGHTTTYDYDGQGNVLSVTDALGYRKQYTYDFYGQVLTSTDQMGNTMTNEYDPQGSLVKTVDQLGLVHQYTHNSSHKIEQYIDPLGNAINNTFDPSGNLTIATDPLGHAVLFDYDANENQTSLSTTVTTENGPETFTIEKVYDTLNRVTEEIDGDGRSVKAEYDALGRQTAVIDKQGNRVDIDYDPRGLIARQQGSDGSTVTNTYDAAGRLRSQMDGQGRVATYEYDAVGNVIKTTHPNGTSTENDYDALGRLTQMAMSSGETLRLEYDEVGRLTSQTDTLGRTTRHEYAPHGKIKKTIDPKGNVFEYDYDAAGAVTKVVLPDNTFMSYTYDDFGRKTSETDQNGHTTYFEWDETGKPKKIIDPLGHETVYSYNDIGYLIAHTDANSHTTRYEYDKLGRMTKKTYPLGMSQTFSYGEDNTFSITDFNGETIQYEFDHQGRMLNIGFPDGTSLSYAYTSLGEIETVTDHRGTTSFEYDGDGRLLTRTDPDGTAISYTYDSLGRKTSITVPSGTTEYEYDARGLLLSVTDPDGEITSYTYDTDDNLASVAYPNGTMTEYGYDSLNRMISVESRTLTSDLILSSSYTLGSKGERLRVEERIGDQTVRTVEYTYDEGDRLIEERINDTVTGERIISYIYDSVGNRLTKNDNGVITTYTYDANDRLLSENNVKYEYDNNGNMILKRVDGQAFRYQYNPLNQLVQAEIPTGGGTSTIDYVYDHDGIRVGKTINGTDVTKYIVDKNRPYAQVLEEQRTNGPLSAVARYVYGHGLVSQSIEGVKHYYHYDGFHSTRALSDMSGTVTDTYQYDAYGMLLNQTGATNNQYLYRSEQFDPELTSYYLRARYYHPDLGRFSSPDPLEGDPSDPMMFHRYLYANCDPVNYFDPSGESYLTDAILTVGVIGGLSAAGWAGGYIKYFHGFYEFIAEKVAPDAGIIGGSGFGKLDIHGDQIGVLVDFFAELFGIAIHGFLPSNCLAHDYYVNPPTSVPIQASLGLIGGGELMFSFGSSQMGFFMYGGFQTEMQKTLHKKGIWVDLTLYTGYVFNLWNLHDYTGTFSSFNCPFGSFFFDPERVLGNKGPWGVSWPILSGELSLHPLRLRKSTSTTIIGANLTGYRTPLIGGEVPYGALAALWTTVQGGIMMWMAYTHHEVIAVMSGFGAASTGFIAKSKQLYNRRDNFHDLRLQQVNNRPDKWKSGPPNPFSKLLGLFL